MHQIEIATMKFLRDLSENNQRKWFTLHRERYQDARANFVSFFSEVSYEISLLDNYLINTKSETHIFRINRDIRFSRNKTPYKKHLAAFLSPWWKKNDDAAAGYYIHIEPWNSFIGWGCYRPNSEFLWKIRKKISDNPNSLKSILNDNKFKKIYPYINDDQKLKTTPRWYLRDHPEIELLRHKNFTSSTYLTDEEVLSKDFQKKVIKKLHLLTPLCNWFNEII